MRAVANGKELLRILRICCSDSLDVMACQMAYLRLRLAQTNTLRNILCNVGLQLHFGDKSLVRGGIDRLRRAVGINQFATTARAEFRDKRYGNICKCHYRFSILRLSIYSNSPTSTESLTTTRLSLSKR